MSIIQNTALLVSVKPHRISGQISDKRITEDVRNQGVADDSVTGSKRLLPRKALTPITSLFGKIGKEVGKITLPFSDDMRLLPMKKFSEFTEMMTEFESQLDAIVQHLIDSLPEYKEDAIVRLGPLYDESEFPDADSLREAITIEKSLIPVPDAKVASRFITDEQREALEEDIRQSMTRTEDRARRALLDRIAAPLQNMIDALNGDKIRSTTVAAVERIVDEIPALNITNDEAINGIQMRLKESLTASSEELRNNEIARSQHKAVAQTAVRLIRKLND